MHSSSIFVVVVVVWIFLSERDRNFGRGLKSTGNPLEKKSPFPPSSPPSSVRLSSEDRNQSLKYDPP